MNFETNHEIVGKKLADLGAIDIGSYYPVVADDKQTVIGVFSAEFGDLPGYRLDLQIEAFVPLSRYTLLISNSVGAEFKDPSGERYDCVSVAEAGEILEAEFQDPVNLRCIVCDSETGEEIAVKDFGETEFVKSSNN